jgi:uncharacterized membrane protein YedE/YeeE
VTALLGGALIGAAVALLLLLNGRVAGISGIVSGLIRPRSSEWGWRALFALGLVGGGAVAQVLRPEALGPMGASIPVLAGAGVLVGFGTRLAGGCTSGHGVCGVSRLSRHSLAATAIFMGVAGAVVFLVRHGAAP